ncbi:MAG: hypothetical protein VKP62_06060 [Candidatus Sericytochromatia bacterium]|nr:hypothetical protein [Candidatus Sericytochromatia bacterium]
MRLDSFKNHGAYQRESEALVRRYDRNGNQALERDEVSRDHFLRRDVETTTNRVSQHYVVATTREVERFVRIEVEAWRRADLNGDGRLTSDEMLKAYEQQRDRNGNGDLGFWERLGMSPRDLANGLERFSSRERVVGRNYIYAPLPDIESDLDRPAPPRPDFDRPAPPSTGPRPPRPDLDRPAPPSTGPRPPRPDFDRPAPPSSRPTPPRPDLDRPAPPSSRPTPPRPDLDRPAPPSSRPTPPRPDLDRPAPPLSRPAFDRPESSSSRPLPPTPTPIRPNPAVDD